MAIKIVSGVLGAGKTYYVVHEILNKYYEWGNRFHEWMPKKEIEIYSNIVGLKLPVIDIRPQLISSNPLSFIQSFFRVDKDQNKIFWSYSHDSKSRVLVIDEAQKIFGRKYYDQETFEFFQLSRQLGFDIYLITQDSFTLSRELQNLSEYEVQAVRRRLQLGPFFRYLEVVNGETIGSQTKKKDQRVFMMYSSMQAKEDQKITSFPLKMASIAIIGVVIMLFAAFTFKSSFKKQTDIAGVSLTEQNRRAGKVINPQIKGVSPSDVHVFAYKDLLARSGLPAGGGYSVQNNNNLPVQNQNYSQPVYAPNPYPLPVVSNQVSKPVISLPESPSSSKDSYKLLKRDQVGYVAVYDSASDDEPSKEIRVFEKSN